MNSLSSYNLSALRRGRKLVLMCNYAYMQLNLCRYNPLTCNHSRLKAIWYTRRPKNLSNTRQTKIFHVETEGVLSTVLYVSCRNCKVVSRWAMSQSRALLWCTRLLMHTLAGVRIKPVTFGSLDGLASHLVTWVEGTSKRSIDCLPPAACIIIEQLFGALDPLLATE